jgi:hypothetical protein
LKGEWSCKMTIHHKFYIWKSYDLFFHVFVIFAHGCCVSKNMYETHISRLKDFHQFLSQNGWKIKWMRIFHPIYTHFKHTTFVCKNYERMNNKFHMISIIKLHDAKFVTWPYNHYEKLIIHSSFLSFFYSNKWNQYFMILPHMYIQHFNFMPHVTFLEKLGPFFHRKKERVFVFHKTQGHFIEHKSHAILLHPTFLG